MYVLDGLATEEAQGEVNGVRPCRMDASISGREC